MTYRLEALKGRTAHTLRRRIRRAQLRVLSFKFFQIVQQRVKLSV